jgi:hypothetical protein
VRHIFLVLICMTGCLSRPSVPVDVTGLQALQRDLDGCQKALKNDGQAVAAMHCSTAIDRFQADVVEDLRISWGAKKTTALEFQFGQLYRTLPEPNLERVKALQSTITKAIAQAEQSTAP